MSGGTVDACMSMKWAIVASISDIALIPNIKSFGVWLASEITKEASKIGTQLLLDSSPSLVLNVLPSDIGGNCAAYERIHKEAPGVQLVVHILPHENSEEYSWMKSLAARFGLIRQGILLENALTHFASTERLQEALRNIIQWIARRSAELARGKAGHEKPFDLRVGTDAAAVSRTFKGPTNEAYLKAAVGRVLHGIDEGEHDSCVRVIGLPPGMGEFAVAGIFGSLTVLGVCLNADEAIVTFKNKFHAHQAVTGYDNHKLDRYHSIRVLPLMEEVAVGKAPGTVPIRPVAAQSA